MSTVHRYADQPSKMRRVGNDTEAQRPRLVRRPVVAVATRLLNPYIRRFAGSKHLRLFALVYHQGRRSGRSYSTPVGARPTRDGFIIPMTFGAGADWFQNVQAAGGCIIRWNGAEYQVSDPEIIGWRDALPAFYRLERAVLPMLGITQFVRLHTFPGAQSGPHTL